MVFELNTNMEKHIYDLAIITAGQENSSFINVIVLL